MEGLGRNMVSLFSLHFTAILSNTYPLIHKDYGIITASCLVREAGAAARAGRPVTPGLVVLNPLLPQSVISVSLGRTLHLLLSSVRLTRV